MLFIILLTLEFLGENVTIQMETTLHFPVVLFTMLYKVVLCFEFLGQMKATEQYFPVVLFIMLYKVVRTFEFVEEILKCDHSNESF